MDVRRVDYAACALLSCGLLHACGGDEPRSLQIGPSDGAVAHGIDAAARPDGGDGGGSRGDSGLDAAASRAPVVIVSSPLAGSEPVTGSILLGSSVDVACAARQGAGGPVDPNKVMISVYAAGSSSATAEVPATLRGTDLYGASVPLDGLPTGRVRFVCRASETASMTAAIGVAEVETFYDAGPTITFTNLNANSVVARGNDTNSDLSIQFKVEPVRLAATDGEADIAEVKLTINDREVRLDPPVNGAYAKELDFFTFFSEAPVDSVTVAVTASNRRTGGPVVVKKQLVVKVDGEGPTISVTAPAQVGGQPPIVGGTVTMQMTITDVLAGVATGSDKLFTLIPYLGETKRYELTAGTQANTYFFTFEASAFSATADITPAIHAFDKAGNESVRSYTMRLDTVPPWVSLNPPNVVEVSAPPRKCSAPFDPVGASPRDGEVVDQSARFRALVWERGIEIPGASIIWLSGVRSDSVEIFAQDQVGAPEDQQNVPLLIDQDRDGTCDAVNNSQALGDLAPFVAPFESVTPGGQQPLPTELPPAELCLPLTGSPPTPRCNDSEMTFVPQHTSGGNVPVVYAHEPTGSGTGCTGDSIDLSGAAGWTCVAVAARDQTGNLGVSPPVRVCRKLSAGDCEGAARGTLLTPPAGVTCTDGCTLPAVWFAPTMPTYLVR